MLYYYFAIVYGTYTLILTTNTIWIIFCMHKYIKVSNKESRF